jgi:DNA repair exonuclease SbcCD ATPase subunit
MKKVTLTRLELRNFKKIEFKLIDFTNQTDIVGTNGVGKSTIFDAYTWLLYGKNSHDQNDFAIKTLDQYNNPIHKLEHQVTGVFDVDGSKVTFRRVYREKWVTKRGNDLEELTGHETTFFVNGVPKSKGEYQTAVSEMIDENISKIISNPLYFNEKMKWNERREILQAMAGDLSNDEIISEMMSNPEELKEILNAGKSLDEQKKIIQAQKKKLKEEKATIQPRINEANYNKPEPVDVCAIQNEIISLDGELNSIDEQIKNRFKSVEKAQEQIKEILAQKFELQNKLSELGNEFHLSEQKHRFSIEQKRNELINEIKEYQSIKIDPQPEREIKELEAKNEKLRSDFESMQSMLFVGNCPTCKQAFQNNEEKESDFNLYKIKNLESIREEGQANNERIKELKARHQGNLEVFESTKFVIDQKETYLKEWEKSILSERPESTPEIDALKLQIESIVIPQIYMPDVAELKAQKDLINEELDALKLKIYGHELAKGIEKRIQELESENKNLAQEIASLEKLEMQIDNFTRAKIGIIENRINSKFALVKWKMFNEQLNGGFEPTCEAIVKGTPFNDLNTAMKCNAGMDVINALNYHFGIFAPVFIDQRESIVDLIKTECQIINLKVDESKKELTVLNN